MRGRVEVSYVHFMVSLLRLRLARYQNRIFHASFNKTSATNQFVKFSSIRVETNCNFIMSSPEGVKNTTIDVSEKDPADGEETVEASTPAENGDVTLKDASGPDVSQDVSDDAEKVEEKADGPTVPEDEGKNGDGSETEGKDKEIEVSKEPEENNSKETEVSKEPEGNVKENDASMETEEKTKEAEASMEPEENDKTEASMETEENDKGTETEKKADPVEEVKTKSKENGTEDQKEDDDENKDEDAEMQDAKDEENAQDDAEETKTPRKRKKYAETLAKESAHILPESDSKRSRRSISANSYQPENFKDESLSSDPKLAITKGRGTALRDIPATKSKITSFKLGDPILKEAHKLLYGGPGGITGKGRTKPGSVKGNVLQFTGYLPAVEDNANATEEEKKAIEENEEKIHVSSNLCSATPYTCRMC